MIAKSTLICGTLSDGLHMFTIEAKQEELDMVDYFHEQTDMFNNRSEAAHFVNYGHPDGDGVGGYQEFPWWWCQLEVQVTSLDNMGKHGVSYLGCCNYKDAADFMRCDVDGYAYDLILEAMDNLYSK